MWAKSTLADFLRRLLMRCAGVYWLGYEHSVLRIIVFLSLPQSLSRASLSTQGYYWLIWLLSFPVLTTEERLGQGFFFSCACLDLMDRMWQHIFLSYVFDKTCRERQFTGWWNITNVPRLSLSSLVNEWNTFLLTKIWFYCSASLWEQLRFSGFPFLTLLLGCFLW